MRKTILALLFACTVAGCTSSTQRYTEPRPLRKVTITGLEDALESNVSVLTEGYYRPVLVLAGSSDPFLRAVIDKQTGETQMHVFIRSTSSDWQRWSHVRYQEEGTLKEAPVVRVSSDVNCRSRLCDHYENVALIVSREQLETWAKREQPLTLRLVSGAYANLHHDMELPADEVRAFLDAVAQVKTQTQAGT